MKVIKKLLMYSSLQLALVILVTGAAMLSLLGDSIYFDITSNLFLFLCGFSIPNFGMAILHNYSRKTIFRFHLITSILSAALIVVLIQISSIMTGKSMIIYNHLVSSSLDFIFLFFIFILYSFVGPIIFVKSRSASKVYRCLLRLFSLITLVLVITMGILMEYKQLISTIKSQMTTLIVLAVFICLLVPILIYLRHIIYRANFNKLSNFN